MLTTTTTTAGRGLRGAQSFEVTGHELSELLQKHRHLQGSAVGVGV